MSNRTFKIDITIEDQHLQVCPLNDEQYSCNITDVPTGDTLSIVMDGVELAGTIAEWITIPEFVVKAEVIEEIESLFSSVDQKYRLIP